MNSRGLRETLHNLVLLLSLLSSGMYATDPRTNNAPPAQARLLFLGYGVGMMMSVELVELVELLCEGHRPQAHRGVHGFSG